MPATAVFSKSVPPIFPPCPTSNKEMRLTAITPTCESPIYEYICSDDGDRLSWHPRHYRAGREGQLMRR